MKARKDITESYRDRQGNVYNSKGEWLDYDAHSSKSSNKKNAFVGKIILLVITIYLLNFSNFSIFFTTGNGWWIQTIPVIAIAFLILYYVVKFVFRLFNLFSKLTKQNRKTKK